MKKVFFAMMAAAMMVSTGVFHFPNRQAARIAIETVKSYPRHALKTIVFNVFLDKDRNIYQQLL